MKMNRISKRHGRTCSLYMNSYLNSFWRFTWRMKSLLLMSRTTSSSASLNCSTAKTREKGTTWRQSCTGCTGSSWRSGRTSRGKSWTCFYESCTTTIHTMDWQNYSRSSRRSHLGLLSLCALSTLTSSRESLFLYTKSRPSPIITLNYSCAWRITSKSHSSS